MIEDEMEMKARKSTNKSQRTSKVSTEGQREGEVNIRRQEIKTKHKEQRKQNKT